MAANRRLETLGDYFRNGFDLRVTCLDCGHSADLHSGHLMMEAIRKGIGSRIGQVRRHLICRCRSRNVATRPTPRPRPRPTE